MITIPLQYAYLFLSAATLAVWCLCFFFNKHGRRRQLLLSSLFSVAGPIGELFYIPDYWHPTTVWSIKFLQSYFSVEDLIFAFSIMGIMSSLPALILRRSNANLLERPSWTAFSKMAGLLAIVGALSLLLWLIGLNSIFATSVAMLFTTGLLLLYFKRYALLQTSLAGAVSMLAVMFVNYWLAFALIAESESILRATWSLYGTPTGIRILRVPLPELVWALSFGSFFAALFKIDEPDLPATKEAG